MKGSIFTVEFTNKQGNYPPDVAKAGCDDPSDEERFANTLASAVLAMRKLQEIWGNGEDFGGTDTLEMAVRFLLHMDDCAMKSIWDFDSPAHAESEGYGPLMTARGELIAAAKKYLSIRNGIEGEK